MRRDKHGTKAETMRTDFGVFVSNAEHEKYKRDSERLNAVLPKLERLFRAVDNPSECTTDSRMSRRTYNLGRGAELDFALEEAVEALGISFHDWRYKNQIAK